MGVLITEVGYTPAMPRMEDHEVHKDMWWHRIIIIISISLGKVYEWVKRRKGGRPSVVIRSETPWPVTCTEGRMDGDRNFRDQRRS